MYRFRLVASFGDRPGSQRHSSCGWTQFLDGVYKSQTTTYPLLQNSWANKFLGLGDGRKSSKSSSDADNTFNNTLKFLPSRPSSKKKQEETKRKRTYLKTQHFLPILTYRCASCSTINNLRRPFMGFVFVSNTGRAGLPSRAAFYLEPGCPHQERPEECLEKLSFSLPSQRTKPSRTKHEHNRKSDEESIDGTNEFGFRDAERDARVRFAVEYAMISDRWPRQARRGGRKSREDGPKAWAAVAAGSVVLGKREELRSPASGRSGKREESTIQRRDRTAAAAADEDTNCGRPARRAWRYGRYPGGKREEITATSDFQPFFWFYFE